MFHPNVMLTSLFTVPNYPRSLHGLGHKIGHANLPDLVRKYLSEQAHPNGDSEGGNEGSNV